MSKYTDRVEVLDIRDIGDTTYVRTSKFGDVRILEDVPVPDFCDIDATVSWDEDVGEYVLHSWREA